VGGGSLAAPADDRRKIGNRSARGPSVATSLDASLSLPQGDARIGARLHLGGHVMKLLSVPAAGRSLLIAGASYIALALGATGAIAAAYSVHPLVTDDQTVLATLPFGPAPTTDPALVNPWDATATPNGGWVVADQGSLSATVYGGTGVIAHSTVSVTQGPNPPLGPTGVINVIGAGFKMPAGNPALYLFDGLDGSISAWDGSSKTRTVIAGRGPGGNLAIYTSLEVATSGGKTYLYAANSITGAVDVFDTNYAKATLPGAFVDPGPNPDGLAPFNIENLDAGHLWVTYATPGPASSAAKLGQGFVSIFNTDGAFVRRFATGGTLSSPWGLAIAPANFGRYGADVLIGNFNDGNRIAYISAFDPVTGEFRGRLTEDGKVIVLPGLWALHFGEGDRAAWLFFTAGIGGENHGLFGKITVEGTGS
jgi:uncharacterized protein (TIGR03118 family)